MILKWQVLRWNFSSKDSEKERKRLLQKSRQRDYQTNRKTAEYFLQYDN